MSDAPMGPGWWQAPDGRWYPPQQPPVDPAATRLKNSTNTLVWVVIGLILAPLLLCGGCVGLAALGTVAAPSTTTRVPSLPAASSGTLDRNGPGSSRDRALPVGTAAALGNNWSVTVESADLDATDRLLAERPTVKPSPGKQYVLVRTTLTNTGQSTRAARSDVDLSLVSSSGALIEPCLTNGVKDYLNEDKELVAGGHVTGEVCFEVSPDELQNAVLLAKPGLFSDGDDEHYLALM